VLPTSNNLLQGRHPPPGCCPRRHPDNTGSDRPRAPTPATGVALPYPQRGRSWRLRRPTTHRYEPVPPPPRRSAGHQSSPAPKGSLVRMRDGEAGSVGPISRDGTRTATPFLPVAPRNPMASTTPLISHRQRLSRRCRRRTAAVVDNHSSLRKTRVADDLQQSSDTACRRRHPPQSLCPRGCPLDTMTDRSRAPTPGTGVGPPPPQQGRPWRFHRPTTHRFVQTNARFEAERSFRISARLRRADRGHACQRCPVRRIDLGSGKKDNHDDEHRLWLRIRLRQCRR